MAFCNAIICNFCCRLSFTFMPPPPQGGRHYRLSGAVCPSVRLSVVCGVPWLNSRTERPRKPKIDRLVARHACIPWSYLEVKRSKVKVARLRDASDRFWLISREWNVSETPKLLGRLSIPRPTVPRSKGQRLSSFATAAQQWHEA